MPSLKAKILERIKKEMGDTAFPPPSAPVIETIRDMIAQIINTFDNETGMYKTSLAFTITIEEASHYSYDIVIKPRLDGMF